MNDPILREEHLRKIQNANSETLTQECGRHISMQVYSLLKNLDQYFGFQLPDKNFKNKTKL